MMAVVKMIIENHYECYVEVIIGKCIYTFLY
jgi:hypothetical protein